MPPRFESSQLLALHRRLCNGDRTASEEVAELLLDPLVERISRQFPRADEHWHCQAVADALLDYCARPQQFDEGQAAQMSATSIVELDPVAGNLLQQEESAQLHQQEEDCMNLLQDPQDQQILALRLRGERRTVAFAAILGISHLPIEFQRREVKRAKDRIDKLLRRKGGHS